MKKFLNGKEIKEIRKKIGMKQCAFAENLGISAQTLTLDTPPEITGN